LTFYIYLIASPDVRQSVLVEWRKIKVRMGITNQVVPAIGTTHRVDVVNIVT
jgi:hypothetical protein